jgi:hypothetical protein
MQPPASPIPQRLDGRPFIGGSDARTIIDAEGSALLRLWREKHGDAGPKDFSGDLRLPQPCDRAKAKPSASPVCAAHADFVAVLAGHPPRPISLDADAIDLADRADHLNMVFSSLSVYVAVIIDDTAQNVPGRLDLTDVEAVLADLASDVTGIIQHAAEGMGWRDA